jgi:hypothetical protein
MRFLGTMQLLAKAEHHTYRGFPSTTAVPPNALMPVLETPSKSSLRKPEEQGLS